MADELPKELFVAFDGNSIRTFLKYLKDTANEVTLEARRCSVRHRRPLGSTVESDDRAHHWDHSVPNQKCQILSTYWDNLPAVSIQVSKKWPVTQTNACWASSSGRNPSSASWPASE